MRSLGRHDPCYMYIRQPRDVMNERRKQHPQAGGSSSQAPDQAGESDAVLCFFSGKTVKREEAVLVRLGPGRKVWMAAELCRDG